MIKAFIIPKAAFKGKIKAEEIIAWEEGGHFPYKVPQAIDFRDELPMSGVGKVLRRVLLEEEVNKGK